ncbi:hypothetical protein F2P79_002566 [Pimephales promelas]|nr:hypothetical protein F2P79_002566 [Pimephales promelas]
MLMSDVVTIHLHYMTGRMMMAKYTYILDALEPSAMAADIERAVTLPSTPRLVVLEEILRGADTWNISVEGACVMGPHSNLLHGLAAVFAAYFVFNLQYPAEVASTLEFLQRW